MKPVFALSMLLISFLSLSLINHVQQDETPKCADPRLEVVLFAQQPDIVHPIALAFDKRGRLLVIESHTHFRPPGYQGPAHDRIRILEDTNGDGKADRITTFFEGTTATMDILAHPDGSIYIATRNEILRLRDTKGAGVADSQQRIVFLDTKGDYPHNGLSGLCFDQSGNLMFGLGENLGAEYKLIGSDGVTLTGGGEGGSIFVCTDDGKKLRRFATGFWNPFGIHVDSLGRVIAVDNDPDSMPPCRLLHIVQDGDYGYQFRYGRSGRHPFQAWNGQSPGTLPMICGTGEAPCEVLSYEAAGLPGEYFGNHLVTSWADHRLERYQLVEQGASFTAQQKIMVQGGKNFRPNGLAVAPDGSLFIADWVLPDYTLHNKGAIWHLRPKRSATFEKASLQQLQTSLRQANPHLVLAQEIHSQQRQNVRQFLDATQPAIARVEAIPSLIRREDVPALLKLTEDADPFIRHAAITHLSHHAELLDSIKYQSLQLAGKSAVLLAQQRSQQARYLGHLPEYLTDEHDEIRFLATKWISDHALKQFRPDIVAALSKPNSSVRMTLALSTALARIDGQGLSEQQLAEQFVKQLNNASAPASAKLQWLRMVPPNHPKLSLKLLERLAHETDPVLQAEAVLTICLHPATDRMSLLQQLSKDAMLTEQPKLIASMGLSTDKLTPVPAQQLQNRPAMEDIQGWLNQFGKAGDAQAGRRIFYHPQGVGCYRCHQIDGRGNEIGPDLSSLGRNEPVRIMESLLQPSATVAPHYQAWTLVMHDGRTLNGILVRTYLDEYTYLDAVGKTFVVKTHDIAETKASPKSIMPEGLLNQLSDQDVRDLLAYLFSRK